MRRAYYAGACGRGRPPAPEARRLRKPCGRRSPAAADAARLRVASVRYLGQQDDERVVDERRQRLLADLPLESPGAASVQRNEIERPIVAAAGLEMRREGQAGRVAVEPDFVLTEAD